LRRILLLWKPLKEYASTAEDISPSIVTAFEDELTLPYLNFQENSSDLMNK
jgi:hypothetical protein